MKYTHTSWKNRRYYPFNFNFSISTFRQLVRYIHYMPSPYGQNNYIIDTLKQDNITNINYQHPHNSQLKLKDIYKRNLKSRKTIVFSLLVPFIMQDIFTTRRYAFQIHLKENSDFRQSLSVSKDIFDSIFLYPNVSNVSLDFK